MDEESFRDAARKLIGRAWADPEFKARLIAEPKDCLAQAGLLEPGLLEDRNCSVKVVSDPKQVDDPDTLHFVLPPAPVPGAGLSDKQLEEAINNLSRWSNQRAGTSCIDITVAPRIFG